jgi:glyoxylase-like metal-dependent hydrolase (beta-lactamase superfamily II)
LRQVADNVFALGTRGHNFYLIIDGDDVTVIDAGCAKEWPKLETGLRANGLSPGQIAAFVITHVHGDHFGLAGEAERRGLRVAVHQDDEPRALGKYTGRFAAAASDLPIYNPFALWHMMPLLFAGVTGLEYVSAVDTFGDGERLDVPGHPIVVHTPGHTEGHAMLHCPELGALFTGDGLVTMDLFGLGTGPQMMRDVFNLDTDQAVASLERIDDLDAALILPGHGDPWRGTPAEAVARVLQ